MSSQLDSIVAKTPAKINIPTYQVVGAPRVVTQKPGHWCGGWHIYGATADKQSKHLAYADKAREMAFACGSKPPKIAKLKLDKLSTKPFAIESSADEFLELCRKNGATMLYKKQLVPKVPKAKK